MDNNQFENTFAELKRSSRVSLVMIIIGAIMLLGSVAYSITRLRPLQLEISSTEFRLNQISSELEKKKANLSQLESANRVLSKEANDKSIALKKLETSLEKKKANLSQIESVNRVLSKEVNDKSIALKKLETSVASLKRDQDKLLDFIVHVADNKQVKLLDPDVDWSSVKHDLAQLTPGDRKQAILVAILMAWKDVPFTMGGNTTSSGFDSPRFLSFVLSKVGIQVKAASGQRLSDALMQRFEKTGNPRPGDIVFYKGQVGSFGLMYLSDGKAGTNPAGIGTLQAISPLQIMSLRNVNTPYFPLIGYFRVEYPDEKQKP